MLNLNKVLESYYPKLNSLLTVKREDSTDLVERKIYGTKRILGLYFPILWPSRVSTEVYV